MVGRGEKFPEEMVAQSKESPGPVRDDEWLERRLPPYEGRRHAEMVPTSAFRRGHLTWDEEKGGLSVQRSEYTKGGVRGEQGMRATFAKGDRQIIRRQAGVRRPIDPEPDLEFVDTAARAAPQPDDVAERAHGERLLVEIQEFADPWPGKHPVQHPVTAQEGGLAGTVLAHEQGDGPQAATLFVLKAAHVLQDQLSHVVHDGILLAPIISPPPDDTPPAPTGR